MGDRRFERAYARVQDAADRAAALRGLTEEELVHALAAASTKSDPYLANVLAVELLRRQRAGRALRAGAFAAAGASVVLWGAILVAETAFDASRWMTAPLGVALAAASGAGAYAYVRSKLA